MDRNIKLGIVVAVLLAVLVVFSGCIEMVQTGEYFGWVEAIEKTDTPEYKIFMKPDLRSETREVFCTRNVALVSELEQSAKDQKKIVLHFQQHPLFTDSACSATISSIEIME